MSINPTSCTSPPKRLQVKPWANSWQVPMTSMLSKATGSVVSRWRRWKSRAISFQSTTVTPRATRMRVALGVTVVDWNEIARDFHRLHRLTTLPVVLLSLLVIGTCHEFAHGVTCKRFGGEVHEVGFMLIYFCPAFYCNVSDAWLFPERSKRLWVTFAGPYFESVIWALATLTWRVTEPDTGLNFAALVLMTTSGIRTLFNFTPLIKLDGYYL